MYVCMYVCMYIYICASRGEALHEETGHLSASSELQTSAMARSEGSAAVI